MILKCALWMEYSSALENLEGFSNALARHCSNQVVGWAILYTLDYVRESQKLIMVHSTLILKHAK